MVVLGVLLTWPVSRRWLENWGARGPERARTWPGDAFAPAATRTYTRAVSVAAAPEAVWPWVVQFGLGRAGFYSYELIERLVGIPVRNVEAILPEHQSLEVGDEVSLHPKAPGIPVAALSPGRYVCFGEAGAVSPRTPDPRRSWSIYIEATSSRSCRLLVRSCIEAPRAPTRFKRASLAIETPIDFAMEQRMLRSLRRLASQSS